LTRADSWIPLAGLVGLFAAIATGTGEFLLHFDPGGRFEGGYDFMVGISNERSTRGHFMGTLCAPLYLIGLWHVMKMLEPANALAARIGFFISSYGMIQGSIWIGSRASVSALMNSAPVSEELFALYELRYETLLQITRVAVLILSFIFVWLTLTGKSRYPRWVAMLNPILLILASFAVWLVVPGVGIYLMPIALNVAFAVLFSVSTAISFSQRG